MLLFFISVVNNIEEESNRPTMLFIQKFINLVAKKKKDALGPVNAERIRTALGGRTQNSDP